MGKLIDLINKYREQIKLVMNAVIILAAMWFIGILIMKAMKAGKDGNYSELGKHVVGALIVVLLAVMGVTGVVKFRNAIAPTDDLVPQENKFQAGLRGVQYFITNR